MLEPSSYSTGIRSSAAPQAMPEAWPSWIFCNSAPPPASRSSPVRKPAPTTSKACAVCATWWANSFPWHRAAPRHPVHRHPATGRLSAGGVVGYGNLSVKVKSRDTSALASSISRHIRSTLRGARLAVTKGTQWDVAGRRDATGLLHHAVPTCAGRSGAAVLPYLG